MQLGGCVNGVERLVVAMGDLVGDLVGENSVNKGDKLSIVLHTELFK